MITEWTVDDPRAPLGIPDELTAAMRFRFLAPAPFSLTGCCESFDSPLGDSGVVLRRCLLDTSQRAHGIVLKKRVAYRESLYIINAPVMLFPFNAGDSASDADVEPSARHQDYVGDSQ